MTTPRSTRPEPRKHGYTFREGLTMMAANGAGIDPYLAAEAGEDAKLSLRALRHALSLPAGPERREALATAARELRNIDPSQHGELVAAIAERIAEAEDRPAGACSGRRTTPPPANRSSPSRRTTTMNARCHGPRGAGSSAIGGNMNVDIEQSDPTTAVARLGARDQLIALSVLSPMISLYSTRNDLKFCACSICRRTVAGSMPPSRSAVIRSKASR
jgi:hypothetical protein